MDKFPRSDKSPLPSSEQREVALDERDILDLHHDLLEAAENLNAFATPGKHERTAIRIPLDNEVLNQTTAGKWQFYTSLSAAYFKDDDIESLGMTFTTPQVYDSIDVRLAAENYWNVTPNGMSGPITSFRNEQLLRLIDAKTAHNTGTIDLIRRLPTLRAGEFPAALMDMLEPLAKINTDIRTYSASDYVISSSSQVESGRVVPEFMSRSTADIVRADGVEAIDYIVRLSFDGLPMQSEYPDQDGNPIMSYISNIYEHKFSITHATGLTSNTQTTFSVISDSLHDVEKVKRYVQDSRPEREGGDIFRKAIQMVVSENLRMPSES